MNCGYIIRAALALVMIAGLSACDQQAESQGKQQAEAKEPKSLVVYTARKEHLIKPLFDRYTEMTGVNIRYITDSAGPLLARLQAEGANTPADILMTVDAGNLWQAAQTGILQPVESEVLAASVPENLRGIDKQWYALTIRARTIVYSTERVQPEQLSTYEALAGPQWQGRVCLRTSKKVYNQSLVATMIAAQGEQATEAVVSGWVANLAMPPFSNDTKTMEAITAGQCDVAIVNTYYFGRLQNQRPDLKLALFWPNQQGEAAAGRGVHVNVSGAGITKASKNKAQAQKLLEWLVSVEAQQQLMSLNMEYPVLVDLPYNAQLQSWGEFKADTVQVSEAGRLQADAVKLMDRAGYK